MLLEEWLNTETKFGELGDVDLVRAKLPKKLKKRRHIETEDGPAGYAFDLSFHPSLLGFLLFLSLNCVVDPWDSGNSSGHSRTFFAFLKLLAL